MRKILWGCAMLAYYPGLKITSQHLDGDTLVIGGVEDPAHGSCPHCRQGSSTRAHRHGALEVVVRDAPIAGEAITLRLARPRFRCAACGTTYLMSGAIADPEFRMTTRMRFHLLRQSLVSSTSALARLHGLDEKTVRSLVKSSRSRFGKSSRGESPKETRLDETGQCECCLAMVDLAELITRSLTKGQTERPWRMCPPCCETDTMSWAGWHLGGGLA